MESDGNVKSNLALNKNSFIYLEDFSSEALTGFAEVSLYRILCFAQLSLFFHGIQHSHQ